MKRTFASIALALSLAFGGLLATATPASAHHTHNAWTLCSEQKNRYYPGSSYTLVAAQSFYNAAGHPTVAVCTIRRNWNYTNFVRCYWYNTHGNYTGGVGICP